MKCQICPIWGQSERCPSVTPVGLPSDPLRGGRLARMVALHQDLWQQRNPGQAEGDTTEAEAQRQGMSAQAREEEVRGAHVSRQTCKYE